MKVWILSKGGGGGGQPQIQTFLNVYLVKVKYFSKVLGHLDRPSCILKTRDNKIILFWCPNFRGEGGVSRKVWTESILSFYFLNDDLP